MPTFMVNVLYQPHTDLWTVRRAHTTVARHRSYHAALRDAHAMAETMRRTLNCSVRVQVYQPPRGAQPSTRPPREEPARTVVSHVLGLLRARNARCTHAVGSFR